MPISVQREGVAVVYNFKLLWGINCTVGPLCTVSAAGSLTTSSLEPRNTRQHVLAVGTNVHHVLAARNAERNEATAQQNAPANITRRACSENMLSYTRYTARPRAKRGHLSINKISLILQFDGQ